MALLAKALVVCWYWLDPCFVVEDLLESQAAERLHQSGDQLV
jgi:hypothetical protein